jgi:prolipoprotein diacylglyceryltransferase
VRPALVLWLIRHGLPGWLAPDYAVLVGVAGIVGARLFLALGRRDRADVAVEARALALGYAAALFGGYVFEGLRALPEAVASGSWDPVLLAGRAAYGGLLAGVAAPAIYLRVKRRPIAPFLDRLTPLLGATFLFVRTGCFLAGCDYGLPTAGPLGVRFPAGSPAAIDHADLGWVRAGAASLPVYPTQLFEAALGVVASVVAWRWLRGGVRDGSAFRAWIVAYAIGRFSLELLRGDGSRGVYLGLSTAQIVSIAIAAAAIASASRSRRRVVAAVAAAGLVAATVRDASAQGASPTPSVIVVALPPAPSAAPSAPPPPAAPPAPPSPPRPRRYVTLRASAAPAFTLGNPNVPSGFSTELAGLYRAPFDVNRFEIGISTRAYHNAAATHFALGLPLGLTFGVSKYVELETLLTLEHNWIFFDSPYFSATNAWGARFEMGLLFPIGSHFLLGAAPLAFSVLSGQTTGVVTTYEPRLIVGLAL